MFDMPLPPPPIELQEGHHQNNGLDSNGHFNNNNFNGANGNNLPPPPPLPPLVESDTASSSSSSLVNGGGLKASQVVVEEVKSTRSYLDDITKRRFVLKPTLKENAERPKTVGGTASTVAGGAGDENNRDTIQPFVNNSDVAAIIDFIRKFRPHVCDSSDDEENSDWDD